MFYGVVLVASHPERSSSSTDFCLSLKHLYHQKVLLWHMGIISEAFL
jgi:hypothetical protein